MGSEWWVIKSFLDEAAKRGPVIDYGQFRTRKSLDLSMYPMPPLSSGLLERVLTSERGQVITALDLSQCNMRGTKLAMICRVLRHEANRVAELNLTDNAIDANGVTMLCEALCNPNAKLEALNLSCNKLDDICCQILAQNIANPSWRLKTLQLKTNAHITEKGARALLAACNISCTMTFCDISGNTLVPASTLQELQRSLERARVRGAMLAWVSIWTHPRRSLNSTLNSCKRLPDDVLKVIAKMIDFE